MPFQNHMTFFYKHNKNCDNEIIYINLPCLVGAGGAVLQWSSLPLYRTESVLI